MMKIKTIILVVFSVFLGFVSATSLSQIQVKPLKLKIKEVADDQGEFLNEVIDIVKKDYVEEKTDTQLAESAATGILSSLDPHSYYLNKEGFKDIQTTTKGEFGGVGIEITSEFSVIKVVTTLEDTPAFKVGIKSGDYITRVNGESIIGLTIDEIVKKLRGKPGSKVKVTILRKGEKAPIEKEITRQIIKVKAVRSQRFGDIGYVKINTFSEQAYSGLVSEIEKMSKKEKFRGFVLDLRGNPGGLLDQAIKVSDVFLDKGKVIVSIKGRDVTENKEFKDDSDETLLKNIPVAVLINEGSASASEIVAGALQDNKRAVVLGIKSFGKGSVQTVIPLKHNQGAVRLTTSLYYTPSGKSIQAHGIEPNIVVTEAKLEKPQNAFERDSEADLKNHIEVQLQQEIESEKQRQVKDDNLELYEKDYQLARALDLMRGIDVYKNVAE